ncbi:MAG TPA: SIMPL domain-containing protein [Planctomycetota bacterium]|nr:SIMPL domain-containing protein [Planctomycetota bacterium]
MEYRIRTDLFRPFAVLALAGAVSLVVSAAVAASAYRGRGEDHAREGRRLSVKGLAVKRVRSDVGVWAIVVKGEAPELKDAYGKLVSGFDRVKAFLRERGFPDAAVGVSAIDTDTHYKSAGYNETTREVVSYSLKRSLTVTSPDVERIADAAGEVTRLIGEGVLVVSSAPEYHFSGLAALKVELMGLAAQDARARADELASNAGGRVGELQDAQMGVLQITRPHSTETASYGVYDTDTIEKDVRAVVTVTFRVEPS